MLFYSGHWRFGTMFHYRAIPVLDAVFEQTSIGSPGVRKRSAGDSSQKVEERARRKSESKDGQTVCNAVNR